MPDAAAASMEAEVMEGEEGLQGRRGPNRWRCEMMSGEKEKELNGVGFCWGFPWNLGWAV